MGLSQFAVCAIQAPPPPPPLLCLFSPSLAHTRAHTHVQVWMNRIKSAFLFLSSMDVFEWLLFPETLRLRALSTTVAIAHYLRYIIVSRATCAELLNPSQAYLWSEAKCSYFRLSDAALLRPSGISSPSAVYFASETLARRQKTPFEIYSSQSRARRCRRAVFIEERRHQNLIFLNAQTWALTVGQRGGNFALAAAPLNPTQAANSNSYIPTITVIAAPIQSCLIAE